LYCPVSSDESQIKEVSIDLFEHFDFSPEKLKTLQGNDKTLPYLINYLEFNEIPLTGAHPGFVVKGGASRLFKKSFTLGSYNLTKTYT
jgi:hypothetical protein